MRRRFSGVSFDVSSRMIRGIAHGGGTAPIPTRKTPRATIFRIRMVCALRRLCCESDMFRIYHNCTYVQLWYKWDGSPSFYFLVYCTSCAGGGAVNRDRL